MPTVGEPVQGYYYDQATDTLRPFGMAPPAVLYTDYSTATAVASWTANWSGVVACSVINGRWVQMQAQLITSVVLPTGAFNVVPCTLVAALRPAQAAVNAGAITYTAYSPCRVQILSAGGIQCVSSNAPASQTQIWVNMGYPLYQP